MKSFPLAIKQRACDVILVSISLFVNFNYIRRTQRRIANENSQELGSITVKELFKVAKS